MDIDDEEDICEVPVIKISEIRKLNEAYLEKKVACQITVKKFDEKMNWYSPFCIDCDKDIDLVDGRWYCSTSTCQRIFPYPDRRFRLYDLCSDETSTIPIVWPDDEIFRLTGKTVYDVEGEEKEVEGFYKIPDILKSFERKSYKITIILKEANVKQGSNIYTASNISNPIKMSGEHSPHEKTPAEEKETEMIMISPDKEVKENSPPTEKSSNRTRPRIVTEDSVEAVQQPNFKAVKIEKLCALSTSKFYQCLNFTLFILHLTFI